MPESHVLDILCRIDYWTRWTRHLGPLSGADPKMEDARTRHILTAFAYASHLGPYQLARHFHGEITGEILATINRRHVTVEKLEAAIRDIINRFNCCPLPRCWGTGKRVAADGTQYDLAEENLLAEKHIRYGGFGGVAYHFVIREIPHRARDSQQGRFLQGRRDDCCPLTRGGFGGDLSPPKKTSLCKPSHPPAVNTRDETSPLG